MCVCVRVCACACECLRARAGGGVGYSRPHHDVQIMTWGKPKPESVKEFKVPGIIWKAHERDESSKDKMPIYVYYTREGEKGGEHKFQAASVKKTSQSKHECVLILDPANRSARIERLHTGINLNEKVGQVPDSRPEKPSSTLKRKYEVFLRDDASAADARSLSLSRALSRVLSSLSHEVKKIFLFITCVKFEVNFHTESSSLPLSLSPTSLPFSISLRAEHIPAD